MGKSCVAVKEDADPVEEEGLMDIVSLGVPLFASDSKRSIWYVIPGTANH
jgi:hypothetical protein